MPLAPLQSSGVNISKFAGFWAQLSRPTENAG